MIYFEIFRNNNDLLIVTFAGWLDFDLFDNNNKKKENQ